MKVVDPHGRRWRVTRRLVMWRPRAMELMAGPDVPEAAEPEMNRQIPVGGGAVMPGARTMFELSGLPLAALERLLLVLLLPVSVLARSTGLLPWTVVVRRPAGTRWETSVRGNAAAGELISQLTAEIERGRPLGTPVEADPGTPGSIWQGVPHEGR